MCSEIKTSRRKHVVESYLNSFQCLASIFVRLVDDAQRPRGDLSRSEDVLINSSQPIRRGHHLARDSPRSGHLQVDWHFLTNPRLPGLIKLFHCRPQLYKITRLQVLIVCLSSMKKYRNLRIIIVFWLVFLLSPLQSNLQLLVPFASQSHYPYPYPLIVIVIHCEP